jgi:hypothetical protein
MANPEPGSDAGEGPGDVKDLIAMAEKYWFHPNMVVIWPVGLMAVILTWATKAFSAVPSIPVAVAAVLAIGLLWGFWLFTNRIPRIGKGRVGILLAISGQTPTHDQQVQVDFVTKLTERLKADSQETLFQVVQLPPFLIPRCQADSDVAVAIMRKAGAHLFVIGNVTLRKVGGEDCHIIDLRGFLVHKNPEVGNEIMQDMDGVVPLTKHFTVNNDALAFEVRTEWLDVAAKYLVGLGAFVSGDLTYAERMLLSAEKKLAQLDRTLAGKKKLGKLIPQRLAELYPRWLGALSKKYFLERDTETVVLADGIADRALQRDAKAYGARIWKAIAAIMLRDDPAEARSHLQICKWQKDGVWRYNLAFVYAYEGNMFAAREQYRNAFRAKLSHDHLPVEVEEFINLILVRQPDKGQLHFVLGLINFHLKGDFTAADREFQAFLAHPVAHQFPAEVTTANEYLGKLALAS